MKDESLSVGLPSQEERRSDLRELFRGAIRMTIEELLEQEVRQLVGASRWARVANRKDVYNGTYLRELVTSLGSVEITVPRTRGSGSPTEVFGRYQRRSEEIDDAIVATYVRGVSTRGIRDVTQALMGEGVSRSTVSRVTKELEEHVEAMRSAPITSPIPYLYLDATFLDARWARAVENVSALVAYGVGVDGHRRLLAVTIGPEESEDSWRDLLQQLLDRGLAGVKLVIADAHAGLAAAVRHLLPEVRLQRCVVHFMRNVLAKAPHRVRARLGKELSAIFRAASASEARRRLQALRCGLGRQVPEAMETLVAGFSAATHYFDFPKEHWLRIRSTNGLERLHGEVKRRIRSVGAFPDRSSAHRLITAVALRATEVWRARRYLDMSDAVIAGSPLDTRKVRESESAA